MKRGSTSSSGSSGSISSISPRHHKSYKLIFYTAALITVLLPYAYLRIVRLWECNWAVFPRLALTLIISSISMVFCYQNLAIARFHHVQQKYGMPSSSSRPGKRSSTPGAVDEEFLERLAIFYSIGKANLMFACAFLLISRGVLEPLSVSRSIVLSTAGPSFLLAFLTRL